MFSLILFGNYVIYITYFVPRRLISARIIATKILQRRVSRFASNIIRIINFTTSRRDNVARVSIGHDFRRIRPLLPPQGWWGPDDGRHDEKEERKRNVRALEIKMIRFREGRGKGKGEGGGALRVRALPGAHVIALWLPNSVSSGSRVSLKGPL